jgi:5-methylcytosine-specific restriction endonuclease McrA
MSIVSDHAACDEVPQRQCRKCGVWLPGTTEYFSKDKKGPNGLHYWCKSCTQQAGRQYKKENRKAMAEYNRRWAEIHREDRLAYKQRYRKENKEFIAEGKRRYREVNRDYVAWDKRCYEAKNPEKGLLRRHRRRAKLKSALGRFDKAYLSYLYELQQGRCCWCGGAMINRLLNPHAPRKEKFTIDHLTPIARGGSSWWWNLVLACDRCNISRNARYVLGEWQPPAMLDWMEQHLFEATVLEVWWGVVMWKVRCAARRRL